MKKTVLSLFTGIAIACLTGCSGFTSSEKSEEQKLQDSLMMVTLQQQNEISALMGSLSEISNKLNAINGTITIDNGEANTDLISQREALLQQLDQVQNTINEKQQALTKLQKQYASQLGKNKELQRTIKRMQAEIDSMFVRMKGYEGQIQNQNTQIAQLNTDLTHTQDTLAEMVEQNQEQQGILDTQDKMLNTAYYIVRKKSELRDMGLIKGGIFSKSRLNNEGFDTSVFTEIDIRDVQTIALGGKDAKILSAVPEASYELQKDEEGMLSLVIKDPVQFWSLSRYLVIML